LEKVDGVYERRLKDIFVMAVPKTVFITGANKGLGFHLVKHVLAKFKPEVVFATYRDESRSKELLDLGAANKNVQLIKLDVKNHQSFKSVAQTVEAATGANGLNLLINNAGIASKYVKLGQVTYEELHDNFETNTIAPLLLTQALLPQILKASQGPAPPGVGKAAVVHMSAILASIGGNDVGGMYPYRCSKAALNMLTKNMSVELKKSKVITIALHPGWVKTALGGPKAPMTPDQSIEAVVALLSQLNESHNGKFLQYDGKELPW